MTDVTQILSQIESGDPSAADQLLPLVYDELRKLAAARLAHEKPGQTLQATALVHDAYIRLVDVEKAQHWNSRGHFFGAAAEAMRRILVEKARQKVEKAHAAGEQEQLPELEDAQNAAEEEAERSRRRVVKARVKADEAAREAQELTEPGSSDDESADESTEK